MILSEFNKAKQGCGRIGGCSEEACRLQSCGVFQPGALRSRKKVAESAKVYDNWAGKSADNSGRVR
ncbi:MAG: hypothetical protein VR65_24015 [Desulfobulbaceae bacterium BRH_c16a]|nr:MAG: hypothetical protein VR65_24015 [Desulfobulbaceae bacterium BRH_c16a]